MLDLSHRNYREELGEQEITGKEQTERTEVKPDLPNSGGIISTPATGQVIAIDRSNDDNKTLEPHTDVYDHRHKEGYNQVAAQFAEPEDLWRDHVTTHHQPVAPAIWAEQVQPVLSKCPAFVRVLTIP